MSDYAISLKRTSSLLAALAFTALLLVVNFASFFSEASAAQLTSRKVVLSSNLAGDNTTGAANTETNGADATHTFTFTPASSATVQAIEFKYCTTAVGAGGSANASGCTSPTGLEVDDTPAVTVQTLDNDGAGGNAPATFTNAFALAGSGNLENQVRFVNATGTAVDNDDIIVFAFDDVTNPTTNGTYFVRITLYNDDATFDGTTLVDEGTVAFSITEQIIITARVAETLGFSVTGAIDTTNVPDPSTNCAPLTGSGAITLGDPTENTLAITDAYDNYSAFRLYTNAANGVAVQYEGDTLRRGTSPTDPDINPIGATPATSNRGTEQFGLAVDTVVGGTADVDAMSRADMNMTYVDDATDFALDGVLTIDADYAGGNGVIQGSPTATFAYETNATPASRVPVTIATTTGYTNCKTVPVRYIANVSPLTTSGTYTTTIVYSAVPTY